MEKGEWVEVKESFSRSNASNLSLDGGDRIQISVNADHISGAEPLFYIDDMVFNSTFECNDMNDSIYDQFIPVDTTAINFNYIRKNELVVYPMPASDKISVQSSAKGTIFIYNNIGKVMRKVDKAAITEEIDISNLNNGIYVISLISGNNIITQKMVIK